ncbi:MAG: RNB domain-containing ribonuclease [Treponema sp.]|nr:RNB domain-containing ribonuclease [Treponema sp.]
MIKNKCIVLYKKDAAVVCGEPANGKFPIQFRTFTGKKESLSTLSVREKDVIALSEGPASLEEVLEKAEKLAPSEDCQFKFEDENEIFNQIKETYELLVSDEETSSAPMDFEELAGLFHGGMEASESFMLYTALKNTVFFSMSAKDFNEGKLIFTPRPQEEIDSIIRKAEEKNRDAELRTGFLSRLKKRELLPEDAKFMGDVEAFALGTADKSKTLHDGHFKETQEMAHRLLLETGIWPITKNPYPTRWGLSTKSSSHGLSTPPDEERTTVQGVSYAIDNAWSNDPDDAVAFDGTYLWVHIADPASTVMPDDSVDKSARERGATLYIPEGAARMLAENALEDYALGLTETSRALSFRLKLDSEGDIEECSVIKTLVKVKRLTYEQADELKDAPELKPLFEIAERNSIRRKKRGAVQISMPEVHITVEPETKKVSISPSPHPDSAEMVREMMVLAGEGAAKFAFQNGIPFPYVSQDQPTIPQDLPDGLAGQYRLRRCMHKRNVGVTPSMHWGLGIGMYTQVTSPLRRYGDLIAHIQLRAFLDGRPMLDKDTMLLRVSAGEESAQAAHKAERKSNTHWTLVYLLQNPDWTGEAICIDNTQKVPMFSIPSLAMETAIPVDGKVELNQTIKVKAANIKLPELTVDFLKENS